MTANNDSNDTALDADQAMNVVLQAEQQAKNHVEQCRAESEKLLNLARQQAQHISARADERLTRIHQRCQRAITDQVKQINQDMQDQSHNSEPDKTEITVLNAVINELAKRLTVTGPVSESGDNSRNEK